MSKQEEKDKYAEAIGRRKTSIARVRLVPAVHASFDVNGKDLATYFHTKEAMNLIEKAFSDVGAGKFKVSAHINGGGTHSQAEALRHAISRALVIHDSNLKYKIKGLGYLKRDPRAKERRKFGLKKARKAPQWSKR